MSESRAVKIAILDKYRQILESLYQKSQKKMSKNGAQSANSGL